MNTALKMLMTVLRTGANGTGTNTYASRALAIPNCLSYHKMNEANGGSAADATGHGYTAVGSGTWTWAANPGVTTNMGTAPAFAAAGVFNFYSAAYANAWNGAELTISAWVRSNGNFAGRWCSIRVDANNRILIYTTAATTLQGFYSAGGTGVSRDMTSLALNTWMHIAMTVSKTANEFKMYVNGVQIGATQAVAGTWTGSLASTTVCWGAENTSFGSAYTGNLSNLLTYTRALTQAEITTLATPL